MFQSFSYSVFDSSSQLARCSQDLVHSLKPLAPLPDLSLDLLELLLLDFPQLVGLDDDLLVLLVDFCINNLPGNGFNRPLLHIICLDVEELGKLGVLEVGLLSVERANLHIRFFEDHLVFFELFGFHEFVELAKFA